MSNRRIGQTPFADLLAGSIADDPTVKACAEAMDQAFDRITRAIPQVLLFARLEHDSGFVNPVPMLPPLERLSELSGGLQEMERQLLDLLAWQLHVESYDLGVNLQAKREMIQASLLLHRRHGTPWSVRHALETLLQVPATLPQWFEYGGKPYFFRARLDVTGVAVDINWILAALQIIMDYKNVRSWLECLETFSTNPLPVFAALASISRTLQASRLWLEPKKVPELPAYAGMAMTGQTRYFATPEPPEDLQEMKPGRIAFAMQNYTRSILCPKY